jgi:hypothetical protein
MAELCLRVGGSWMFAVKSAGALENGPVCRRSFGDFRGSWGFRRGIRVGAGLGF